MPCDWWPRDSPKGRPAPLFNDCRRPATEPQPFGLHSVRVFKKLRRKPRNRQGYEEQAEGTLDFACTAPAPRSHLRCRFLPRRLSLSKKSSEGSMKASQTPRSRSMKTAAVVLLHLLALTPGSSWGYWVGGGRGAASTARPCSRRPMVAPSTPSVPFWNQCSASARTALASLAASTPAESSSTPSQATSSKPSSPPFFASSAAAAAASSNDSTPASNPPAPVETATPAHQQKQHQQKPFEDVAKKGRVLEGGKVIDFSNVKASDRAEVALRRARERLLAQPQPQPSVLESGGVNGDLATANGHRSSAATASRFAADSGAALSSSPAPAPPPSPGTILGINRDVVELVGHDLGAFATPGEIQGCASYLRSKAPPGLLESAAPSSVLPSSEPSLSAAQLAHHREILDRAYYEAGEVTSAFAKTFYMGTMLLPPRAREAIWAVYVWCRRTDEIVDAPRDKADGDDRMLLDLSAWEMRLEDLFRRGTVVDVYDLCLLDCRIKYPTMSIAPYMDMIRGMLMDVPGIGQDRYDEFDELHLYCYRVAGTVGLMSLPIFGCAPGFDDETAREPALSLGVAFQLTNILRDVGEDAVKRGRVYLPQEDLRKFGVTEDQIFARQVDSKYVELMKYEISRARMYYERARRGVFMLAPESRLPVQSSLDAYGRILDKIEANGYDSLTKRAYVDKWEKLSMLPASWYRTLDISRILPLPGDKPVVLDRI